MKNIENPKITVLLSVFNDEKYIKQSINSILSQTFTDFELLIIDDCSTDNTTDILKVYKDPRIKIIINNKNIGITKSLNKGLKIARGEYIARHDSDDISYPDRLKKQFNFLERNKSYVMVGSHTNVIDESSNHIEYWNDERTSEEIFYTLSYTNILTSSSIMFCKKILDVSGDYNETYDHTEDYELWYRISRKGKIYVIPENLVKWRKTKSGQSSVYSLETEQYLKKTVLNNYKIDERLLDYLLNKDIKISSIKKLSFIKELNEFHINIQKEGKKIGLGRVKIKSICYKKMIVFIIKIIVGKKGKILLKRILRLA